MFQYNCLTQSANAFGEVKIGIPDDTTACFVSKASTSASVTSKTYVNVMNCKEY